MRFPMRSFMRHHLPLPPASWLTATVFAAVLSAPTLAAAPAAKPKIAPVTARFDIPQARQTLVFAAPVYRAEQVEETPYQSLQLCDAQGGCRTVADMRGTGALTMPADATLGLSPDKRYVLCLQFSAVDAATRSYRQHAYVVYDLAELAPVVFRTADGKRASTDNIQGWAKDHPHALEISAGLRKTALALPTE